MSCLETVAVGISSSRQEESSLKANHLVLCQPRQVADSTNLNIGFAETSMRSAHHSYPPANKLEGKFVLVFHKNSRIVCFEQDSKHVTSPNYRKTWSYWLYLDSGLYYLDI